ncbi:MAG: hypothetical protein GC184_00760 [Rhizobiales bacterium]|nr:hypothetical protein [Hyphomicrobiales bacterium]
MAGKKQGDGATPLVTRKSRRRELSEEEHRLWQIVTREATPLARRRKRAPADETVAPAGPLPMGVQSSNAPMMRAPVKSSSVAPVSLPAPAPFKPAQPPPLTGLDRRTTQRLTRGQIDYEAKLDLHGYNQAEAHDALRAYLARCRASGMRCVLVVTGKGESPYSRHTLHGSDTWHAPERPGVLRSALPRWLGEAEFRALVAGFQPAHPKHGGGGAFYIWLRRKR